MAAWRFDEAARAGPEHLDPAYVASYDQKSSVDFGDDVERLRDHGLDESATLVDLGCGTGAFAVAAAPHCLRVVAVDVSPAMIELAAAKAVQAGAENVDCVAAGFLSYEHAGDAPGFAYSRNALHHLPDFWKALALRRVAEMLQPGGVFLLRDLVFSFDPAAAGEVLEEWLTDAPRDPSEGWTRDELETHLKTEFSTYTWLLEPMIERAGFEILDADHGRLGVYATYLLSSSS